MGKFIIRTVASGIKFDLTAGNGQIIAASEIYLTRAACLRGIASVQRNAPKAGLEDLTAGPSATVSNPKFQLFQDKAGQFRFRLRAHNGKIIAASEGCTTKASALGGASKACGSMPRKPKFRTAERKFGACIPMCLYDII